MGAYAIARLDVHDIEELDNDLAGHRYRSAQANIVIVDGRLETPGALERAIGIEPTTFSLGSRCS